MQSSEGYGGFLEMQKLLLLDEAMSETRQWVFDLIIWASLFAATQIGRLPNILRHLRVLPLAAPLLNMLLVAWPALMVITVWAGLVGLRAVVSGSQAVSLQPALLVALIGSSAIARAINLRWLAASPWVAFIGLCAGPALSLFYGPSSAFLVVLGIGGIAAAAALNHVTLMQSATYRKEPAGVRRQSCRIFVKRKMPTPRRIAMSATLKMPVRSGPTPTLRKSMTLPCITRSTRFDAPPAK